MKNKNFKIFLKCYVFQIMPFQDELVAPYSELVNEDYLKKPEDVIIELRLTKELSDLRETAYDKDGAAQMTPNFVRLVKAHVVQGMKKFRLQFACNFWILF